MDVINAPIAIAGTFRTQHYSAVGVNHRINRGIAIAITQRGFVLGDAGDIDGGIIVYYDQANSRYSRYAECMFSGFEGRIDSNNTNNTIGMCARGSLQTIPAFILTKQREIFVRSKILKKSILYFLMDTKIVKL